MRPVSGCQSHPDRCTTQYYSSPPRFAEAAGAWPQSHPDRCTMKYHNSPGFAEATPAWPQPLLGQDSHRTTDPSEICRGCHTLVRRTPRGHQGVPISPCSPKKGRQIIWTGQPEEGPQEVDRACKSALAARRRAGGSFGLGKHHLQNFSVEKAHVLLDVK